jgi:tRNA (guanine37-N1)-methyltransferase
MQFNVVTIFPKFIESCFKEGVVGLAVQHGQVKINIVNPRDFATDKYQSVDDRPFGGGDGMVMTPDPLIGALESLGTAGRGRVIFLTPQGQLWNDGMARQWAAGSGPVTLICGRYAGVDQRVINSYVDEEISVGDYVLSGGELPAMVLMDSIIRLIPGVLGNPKSVDDESFAARLLEGPVFTRPGEHKLGKVPAVLTGGNHREIAEFRRRLAYALTALKRPELLLPEDMAELKKSAERLSQMEPGDLEVLGITREELKPLLEGK